MEKEDEKIKLPPDDGRNTVVSRKDMIASVPVIRIVNGIRVHIPAVVVPVAVDHPQHIIAIVQKTIRTTAL